jgi:DNA-binding LacI/PurR family transcriptional regulator
VDFSEHHPVVISELTQAEQYLAKLGIALSWAGLSTDDIVQGRHPVIIEKNVCQGLVIDGVIRDCHLAYFDQWDIPYVVIGGYHLDRKVNRVWADIHTALITACEKLIEKTDQPLILMIDAYGTELTQDIIDAYRHVAHKYPRNTSGIELCEKGEELSVCEEVLQRTDGHFSIVTRCTRVPGVIDAYRRYGLDVKDNPILAFGASHCFPQEYENMIYRIPIDTGQLSLKAVRRLMQLCRERADDPVDLKMPLELSCPTFDSDDTANTSDKTLDK